MPGILDSMTSMLSPAAIAQIARAIDVNSALVHRGFAVTGPLVLSNLAKSTATPKGAATVLRQLPQDGGSDLLGHLMHTLMHNISAAAAARPKPDEPAESLFGVGTNAVTTSLTRHIGFNARPLLVIATPLVLGLISRVAKSRNLNAAGLAEMLRSENDTFMKSPTNREAASVIFTALSASDKANALRQMFDEAEWLKVRTAPLAALYYISNASPSGAAGLAREFTAAADAISEAAKAAPPVSLLGTAFGTGLSEDSFTQLTRQKPETEALLSDLHDTICIVARRSPSDTEAYREVILFAAQRAAEANKEGSFLGIGGTRVSQEEQRAIDEIRSALR